MTTLLSQELAHLLPLLQVAVSQAASAFGVSDLVIDSMAILSSETAEGDIDQLQGSGSGSGSGAGSGAGGDDDGNGELYGMDAVNYFATDGHRPMKRPAFGAPTPLR